MSASESDATSPTPLSILKIDTREQYGTKSFLMENLEAELDKRKIRWEREKLPEGDFRWDTPSGIWVVERKEIKDLLNSLKNGRLKSQASRLKSYTRPYLAIHGMYHEWNGVLALDVGNQRIPTGWKWNSIMGILTRFDVDGLRVVRLDSANDFVLWLCRMYTMSIEEGR